MTLLEILMTYIHNIAHETSVISSYNTLPHPLTFCKQNIPNLVLKDFLSMKVTEVLIG